MIWQAVKHLELTGGGKLLAGTMVDGLSLHIRLRVGSMQPLFDGYNTSFSSATNNTGNSVQFYFFIAPEVNLWAYNALLSGGIFGGKGSYYGDKSDGRSLAMRNVNTALNGGLAFVAGRASLSLTQKTFSSVLNHVPGQSVGNISITYSW